VPGVADGHRTRRNPGRRPAGRAARETRAADRPDGQAPSASGTAAARLTGDETLVAGRYRLQERLSERDGSAVWRATDESLTRTVNVRTFAPGFRGADAVIAAARSAAQLSDARLVQIFDADDRAERPYIVTEWPSGERFDEVIAIGPLEPKRAAEIIAEAADALAVAHAAGLAHLCLTPESLWRNRWGEVKISGLGTAAALAGAAADDEAQDHDAAADDNAAAADTRGLASLLYAALTGYWPGPEQTTLPAAPRSAGRPDSPARLRAGITPDIDAVTCRALFGEVNSYGPPILSPAGLAVALAAIIHPSEDTQPLSSLPARTQPFALVPSRTQRFSAIPAEPRRPAPVPAPPVPAPPVPAPPVPAPPVPAPPVPAPPVPAPPVPAPPVPAPPVPAAPLGSAAAPAPTLAGPTAPEAAPAPTLAQRPPATETVACGPAIGPRTRLAALPARSAARTRAALGGLARRAGSLPSLPAPSAAMAKPLRVALVVLALVLSVLVGWLLGQAGSSPGTGAARGRMLIPVSAAAFDPYGSGQNDRLARLAIDASAATAWHTQWYTTARFGNLKPGTGLLIDLGRPRTITSARIKLGSRAGADFQLRVGAAATSLARLRQVAHATGAGGRVAVRLAAPARGRYVLIWFTKLPPDGSGAFEASVYNVRLQDAR
jgi:hypothetical protein